LSRSSAIEASDVAVGELPLRAVLAVADGEAKHLAVPVAGHPGGHNDGLGHHPPFDPGLP
jgi:hypothetical protein